MRKWQEEKYKPLVGAVIEDVFDMQDEDGVLCFIVKMPNGSRKALVPLRDEEGNGPGYLEVNDVVP